MSQQDHSTSTSPSEDSTTTESGAPGAKNDVQTDPSGGTTWNDEGGATPTGPATDTDQS